MTTTNVQDIEIGQLSPTKQNSRIPRQDNAFDTLVKSIETHGVIQPLIARPMPDGQNGHAYDLRAGHRRLAAAKKAGLATVPVIVRDMDDKTAVDITFAENFERENLTPLEESKGIRTMLEFGWTVEDMADRLGKPTAWVARRAKLGDLSKAWQKAIADPEHRASFWSGSLLGLVARLNPLAQTSVLNAVEQGLLADASRRQNGPVPTTKELDHYLKAEILNTLGGAPFKLDDETLVPKAGACTVCPKRASHEPLLFEELLADQPGKKKANRDRCTDHECYEKKLAAHTDRAFAEAGKSAIAIIDGASSYQQELLLEKKYGQALHRDEWNMAPAKKGDKGAVPAVVVAGSASRIGRVKYVMLGTPLSSGSSQVGKREAGTPTPLKERRLQLGRRRQAMVVARVAEFIEGIGDEAATKVLSGHDKFLLPTLLAAFGTDHRADSVYTDRRDGDGREIKPWKVLASDHDLDALNIQLFKGVMGVWLTRLRFQNNQVVEQHFEDARRMSEILKLDFAEFERRAATEIPEPKGWAKLNADGTLKGAKPTKKTAKKKAAKKKVVKKKVVKKRPRKLQVVK